MKFYEKIFVGVKYLGDCDLGFMTPWGTDVSAEKRMKSVQDWALDSRYYHAKTKTTKEPTFTVYDNKPMEGFEIVNWVSRYTTDNKWARILDPRGFELEITIRNLIHLILTSEIKNGKIQGNLVWLRDGAQNWLTQETSSEYKTAFNPVKDKKTSVYEVGDTITNAFNVSYMYLGKKKLRYVFPIGKIVLSKTPKKGLYNTYYQYHNFEIETMILKSAEKPTHIYLTENGSIVERKSKMTVTENKINTVSIQKPTKKFLELDKYERNYYTRGDGKFESVNGKGIVTRVFYATLDECSDLTEQEIQTMKKYY